MTLQEALKISHTARRLRWPKEEPDYWFFVSLTTSLASLSVADMLATDWEPA